MIIPRPSLSCDTRGERHPDRLSNANTTFPAPHGRPVKVLHLITSLETGGAEAMLVKLVCGMDRTRFRPMVVSLLKPGPMECAIAAAGIPVRSLGMPRGIPDPRAAWNLLKVLRDERPDVLQTWLYHADLLGIVSGRLARVPSVVWNLRCSDMRLEDYSPLTSLVLRALARISSRPDAVVYNAEAGRKAHEAHGYRPRLWKYIPNGFDLQRFRPDPEIRARVRAQHGIPADDFLLCLPARVDPMKDHENFARAAGLMAAACPEVRFALIGRGVEPSNGRLVELLSRHGILDRTHMLGQRLDMEAMIPAMDAVTLTSAYGEGFPNVLGEAMSCEVPCVATDVGDSRAILGDAGLVVPPSDPEALARAWMSLVALGPAGRAEMGARGRRRVEASFSLPLVIERYERLYASCARAVGTPS
jgi:glycosyltransferase involved in cell wall biosynthesis